MVAVNSVHPTNYSPYVLRAAKPNGVPLRKNACGMYAIKPPEEPNGGGALGWNNHKIACSFVYSNLTPVQGYYNR
jgi:hypothetical protein